MYPLPCNCTLQMSPKRESCSNSESFECPSFVSLSSVLNFVLKIRLMLESGTLPTSPGWAALSRMSCKYWRAVSHVAIAKVLSGAAVHLRSPEHQNLQLRLYMELSAAH